MKVSTVLQTLTFWDCILASYKNQNLYIRLMNKFFLIGILLLCGTIANGQVKISLDEVKQHMGDSVQVCGKVSSTRFLESANGTPTLINLGQPYPNEKLTLVIYGENRAKFNEKPELAWKEKTICVTGKIVEYRGKPQIVVIAAEQVVIQP